MTQSSLEGDFTINNLLNRFEVISSRIKNGEISEGVAEEIYESLERYTYPENHSPCDKQLLSYLFRGWMMTKMAEKNKDQE